MRHAGAPKISRSLIPLVALVAAATLGASCAPDPSELRALLWGSSETLFSAGVGNQHPARGPFAPVSPEGWAQATWGEGARFVAGEGSNLQVGVFSANATRVLLEVYDAATGTPATFDYWMERGVDNIFRAELEAVPGKTLYAFRAFGPNWPFSAAWSRGGSSAGFLSDVDTRGNRFNPNKVLVDPYALEHSHDKSSQALSAAGLDVAIFGSGPELAAGAPRRAFDTGPFAPKAVALVDGTDTGRRPRIAAKDSIVYEAHVRGLTQHPSSSRLRELLARVEGFEGVVDVPADCRGTYKAAALMAPYLKGLGVNVLELLPVHESDNDGVPLDRAGGNFWGYATTGFFAPDRRYACDRSPGGPTREFKEMVRALHEHGVEVWLDVVYNHTGEGGLWDRTRQSAEVSSLRGLDNASWYALVDADPSWYWESTGCGNNVNFSSPAAQRLVLESLAYWSREMGVDGFRFDLATVLGRDRAPRFDFRPEAPLLAQISALAAREELEVVAEAWDLSSYGVGQFPKGWAEWNGRYRDATRRFLKGDPRGAGISAADAFYGDYGNFADQGGPSHSVNFVVAHDGFTLADLVSYPEKTNTARLWPFGPSDGGNDSNESWDSGGNHALRRQRFRNFVAWQLFSRGVPMVVAGDELARTQNGNNNPYNLDAPGTWNNYEMVATDAPHRVPTGVGGEAYHDNFAADARADGLNGAFLFTKELLALRQRSPALRQGDYRMPIFFAKHDGAPGYDSYRDRSVRIHLDGSEVGGRDLLLFVNMAEHAVEFRPPAGAPGERWSRIVDTAAWAEPDGNTWSAATGWRLGDRYTANPWSIVAFEAVRGE